MPLGTVGTVIGLAAAEAAAEAAGGEIGKRAASMPWARLKSRLTRGKKEWGFGAGMTLIVIPETDETKPGTCSPNDLKSASLVARMFLAAGRKENHHWKIVSVPQDARLTGEMRQANLVLICGSNSIWLDLMSSHPDFLKTSTYIHSRNRTDRKFVWGQRIFGWTESSVHALLAVKPRPFDKDRRCVALIGLRDSGTLGAAIAFADPAYGKLRKRGSREWRIGDTASDIELLLRVDLDRGSISGVDIAEINKGDPLVQPQTLRSTALATTALGRIADSLFQHPRSIRFSEYTYEIVYGADYSVRINEQFTLQAVEDDVIMWSARYGSPNAPVSRIDQIGFQVDESLPTGTTPSTQVEVVVARDEPTRRQFLMFPIPPIARKALPRTYKQQAVWPNAGRKLATRRVEDHNDVTFPPRAVESINKVTLVVKFELEGDFEVMMQMAGAVRTRCSREKPFSHALTDLAPGQTLHLTVQRV